MRPLAELLAERWQVLLWDMPGHGKTLGGMAERIDQYADALEAVMDAAGARSVAILGFSFGGVVSQLAAVRNPSRYRALIAYGCYAPFHQRPTVPHFLHGLVEASYRLRRWDSICAEFTSACSITDLGRKDIRRALAHTSKPVFISMVRCLLASFQERPNVRFDMPLLCLRGAYDSPLVVLGAHALLEAHTHAREFIVPDAGHCAHNDALASVALAVDEFLRKCVAQDEP